MTPKTILHYLIRNSANAPDKQAIFTTAGTSLSNRQLLDSVNSLGEGLWAEGVKEKRVVTVVTEGLDWVVCFFAVSSVASFVPMDPSYSREQFIYYFNLLKPDFLLLETGYYGSVCDVAAEMGIKVLFFSRETGEDGVAFRMESPSVIHGKPTIPEEEEVALVSFTSGTTSTPKIVPVTHKNLCSAAEDAVRFFELGPSDRCLIIPPIFKGVVLSTIFFSLAGEGSVVIAENMQPDHFFYVMNRFNPTWFRAAPVFHSILVDFAEKHNIAVSNPSLRFVRTGGAHQEEAMAKRMASLYGVPVAFTYGLSETRILTCQFMPSKGYKKGSVGISIGSEIGIMDERGTLMPSGELGEVVVRGPSIFNGYANPEIKHEETFFGEWFRTGDLGLLDEDGSLFLKGRIKEIINRGGEKVSPLELEQILMEHPGIQKVAVFPIRDGQGDEEVGCLIVPSGQEDLSLKEIRGFLAGKISHFKMPTRLYLGAMIPVSSNGKISRNNLYHEIRVNPGEYHLLEEDAAQEVFETSLEESIGRLFRQVLGVHNVGPNDNFFDLGGDSLKAATLFTEIQNQFHKQVPLSYIYKHGTVRELAVYLESREQSKLSFIVPIQERGTKPPLFFVHPARGEVVSYQYMSEHMTHGRPTYGLRMNNETVDWKHPIDFREIARKYIEEVKMIRPEGPYLLAGTCLGGVLAYEMAQQLTSAGEQVTFLGMFDAIIVSKKSNRSKYKRAFAEAREAGSKAGSWAGLSILKGKASRRLRFYRIALSIRLYKYCPFKKWISQRIDKEALLRFARRNYKLEPYRGEIVFFRPEENSPATAASLERWEELVATVNVVSVDVPHNALWSKRSAKYLAAKLEGAIDSVETM